MIKSLLITVFLTMSSVFGGPVGITIGGILGAGLGGAIANQLTKHIINTIGGTAANELTYNTYAFDLCIPFRKNELNLSIKL